MEIKLSIVQALKSLKSLTFQIFFLAISNQKQTHPNFATINKHTSDDYETRMKL